MISLPAIVIACILVVILIMLRIPIAGILIAVGFGGIAFFQGFNVAIGILKNIPYDFASSWSLSSLPMYLIMGYLAYQMGMAEEIYNAVRLLLRKVPGALSVSTAFACAGFGAVCGSAGATAAAFGRLSVPEMLDDNYDKGLATGSIAASGTMGSLMPPSILMIVYASLAEISVGRCFMAGILPCILSAAIYGAMVMVRVKINPQLAPVPPRIERLTLRTVYGTLFKLWDVLILIVIIFGGIYGGFVTATEAGAFGAFAALMMGIFTRRLNFEKTKDAFFEGARVTAMILIIAVGANIFVRFLAFGGVPEFVATAFAGFSPLAFIGVMFVVYFFLGMFLDPIGMMLLTVPVLLPVLGQLDISLVWFCIIVIKNMELANITPPVGLTVYVIKGVITADIPIETIFKGIAWFAVMDVITLAILIFFPQISLIVPDTMLGR